MLWACGQAGGPPGKEEEACQDASRCQGQPNNHLQPTASSLRCAAASGSG